MKKPQPFKFSQPQSDIECALGILHAASRRYGERGNHEKASRLKQLAEETAALRDPEVVAFHERRLHRRAVQAERQRA